LKIVFIVLALTSGIICLLNALAYAFAGERFAAAVCTYAGGFSIILGLLGGLLLVDAL